MPTVQHLLAFARPLAARVRSVRRPFRPSPGESAYRLPHDVRDRLALALQPFRNREAAFALATFLARFHSHADRLLQAFVIDRRALADHAGLELTEARVRGAIKTLEAVGYLERALASGSTHKATEDGLRRKPIRFVFGPDYAPAFLEANRHARAARGGRSGVRRPITPASAPRPSAAVLEARATNSPKDMKRSGNKVYLGEMARTEPAPVQPFTPLPRLSDAAMKVFGRPKVG